MIILIGASSDIGKELLPRLLENNQVLGTSRNCADLKEFKDNENFSCISLDLTSQESVEEFCEHLSTINEKITYINLSSISVDKLFLNYAQDEWDRVINVNVSSSLKILQRLIPVMMRSGWGRIIHVSSVVAQSSVVGASAYSASKAAVIAMTRSLAHEYGRMGITANTIVLGYFNTGLIHSLDEERQRKILDRIPSRKFGQCEDIFYAIEHITKSDYLNGSEITIDGGLM